MSAPTALRSLLLLLTVGSLSACGLDIQTSSTLDPGPGQRPPDRKADGGRLKVALLPTVVSGIGETRPGAWSDAFRLALAEDPRFDFADPKAAEKTLERHRKGRFNALTDVTADLWIESSAYTEEGPAYNKLTGKFQSAPQLKFKAVVRWGLDDRSGNTFIEGGRFFMNAPMAVQHKEIDVDLVKKVSEQVRARAGR